GPTDDGSRLGIPTVDDQIQFEDMMIFAMNFNVVSPTGMPPVVQLAGRPEAGPPVLRLESTEMAKGMTVSLCLGGNTAEVKAVSMVLTYDPEILEMVSVTPTLADQVLFEYREAQPGEVWVDLAALGTDVAIQGSGEIAQITFDVKSDGDMNIRFAEADLRGVSNGRLSSSTEGLAFDFRSSTPSVTELAGAWPNPFNPTTSIQYNLRHAEHVTLQIYDAQGRLVRTLVNETMNAGRYSTVWNGRDNNGVEVSSGTYFVRMHTSRYESTSKVVMLK
ncbi:MAG: T9SS type A sorting domain-containing protein, partial [Candidatus Eisenbacteria sp.]|nr:T9SS type A sorting domain-containing protein [Candidatus Eisenbacteria bacterium]